MVVFSLIAVRQIGRFNLKIWQIMTGGALVVLLTGQISIPDAVHAINSDVMLFLFGMFIIGQALIQSGYLSSLSYRFFKHATDPGSLILLILMAAGVLSAFLMNDTLAIIFTPLVLSLAQRFRIRPQLVLLTLAVAVTTGSVMSPIGNPQNLLVAVNSGIATPFLTFGYYLALPTLLCIGLCWLVLRYFYPTEFAYRTLCHTPPPPPCRQSARAVKVALAVILLLVAVTIATSLLYGKLYLPLPAIALAAAIPALIGSRERIRLLRSLDWHTLIFFASMFILMESVWQTGFFQSFLNTGHTGSIPMILVTSVFFSQFISNVPFVALVEPMILNTGASVPELMALAAGSTIAGNLTILGAASNVIIIENAEKKGYTLSFCEFAKVGIPLTIIQVTVYGIFLMISL